MSILESITLGNRQMDMGMLKGSLRYVITSREQEIVMVKLWGEYFRGVLDIYFLH